MLASTKNVLSSLKMIVLSLFEGMAVGRLALKDAGIKVDKYYASEIDKYAIAVASKNFEDILHLGDIKRWRDWDIDFSKIDLLIGGSPCQGFSFAGKGLNFGDERSKLFFEYLDILSHIKSLNPEIKFLLENVRMKKEYQNIISSYLGVEPIEINSALVSAQRRKRLYWTNIENVELPEDKGILLKDIVHENTDVKYMAKENWCEWFKQNGEYLIKQSYIGFDKDKAITQTARQYGNWQGNFTFEWLSKYIVPFDKTLEILERETKAGKIGYFNKDSQGNRIYYIKNKSVTLMGEAGGLGAKTGLYLFGCIAPDRVVKRQNGARFSDGQKFYTLTATDKHGILIEGYIRKLTPIECERLQTLPDNYTAAEVNSKPISDNQRYKMLGNGWTKDVIVHILKNL